MSIYGIGIDIVQIDRMNGSIEKYGDVFAKKILHANEVEIYLGLNANQKPRYLAKRFAAKEAFSKALGTGIVEGITLPKIEVTNSGSGKPSLVLHQSAKDKVEAEGITRLFLSLSDEKVYAVAQVVLES